MSSDRCHHCRIETTLDPSWGPQIETTLDPSWGPQIETTLDPSWGPQIETTLDPQLGTPASVSPLRCWPTPGPTVSAARTLWPSASPANQQLRG
ncbi:unnamed protein product [Gadus morhua 'NCC']